MKVVILGCGRVGARLARLLLNADHEVTMIDQNGESFRRLGSDFPREATVLGDGTDEDVLKRAGIEEADVFVAVTNGDNRNILAAQVAQHLFQVPRVMCRIYDPIRQETYNTMGLESICPTIVGAKLFHDALLNPVTRSSSVMHSLAQGRSVPMTPMDHTASRQP
ncbi:MAG: TrkA-like protein [Ktedonobacterales bacterium]|jgi:trk system potassium uptake protein TrkA|nr:MAG: TrkA-like protein [Ktedonobacterales bacterium]